MTTSKSAVIRPFRPERASKATMAYLLDISVDTFDRLVRSGDLPAAKELGGIARWIVDDVYRAWDRVDAVARRESDSPEPQGGEPDPRLANIGAFRGKKENRRAAS